MTDLIPLPSNAIDSTLKVLAMFLGSAAFLKFLGLLSNKLLDRRIKLDEYTARDGADFIKYMQQKLADQDKKIEELDRRLEDKRAVELGLKMQVIQLQNQVEDYHNENQQLKLQMESLKLENQHLKSLMGTSNLTND
jgi:hypothetical protein